MTQETPTRLLEIYRDFVAPGSEEAYRTVEEDAAAICADLGCPHPHLAIESLSGPKEVWWLNGFESQAHYERAVEAYRANGALTAALEGIGKRKEGLVGLPDDRLVTYRADLSRGAAWKVAGTRFVVATVTRQDHVTPGAVFEAPDGTRFILRPAATHAEADSMAAAAGAGTTIFAVRPYWGMAASDWIASDPEFWSSNPAARGTLPSAAGFTVRPPRPDPGA
jgi:hypothetical protein